MLGERDQRETLEPLVARLGRLVEDALHLHRLRRQVGDPARGARGEEAALERRLELDGAHEQAPRGLVRLAGEGAAAGLLERRGGPRRQLGRRRTVELLVQRRRVVEVVGADLDELLAGPLVQPVRDLDVQLGPRSLGEARVGDVPDEHVLEPIGMLAGDRGAVLADDEVAQEQASSAGSRSSMSGSRCSATPSQKIRPITDARWSSRFSLRGSRSMRAAMIAWSVSGMRFAVEPPSSSIRVVSSTKSGLPSVFSSSMLRSSALSSWSASSASSSSSLSSGASGSSSIAVARSRPPPQPGRMSSSSGRARQRIISGRVLDALGEVLEQLEQRLLRPVHVLEDEDQRLRVGELGGPLVRRPRDVLLAALRLDALEHADGEREQVGHGVVAAAGAQLRDRLLDGIVVCDPGRYLDHLGERPVRHALAVGKRAAAEDRSRPRRRRRTPARAGSFPRPARRRS